MAMFGLIVAAVWAAVLAAWWIFSQVTRRTDTERLRQRLSSSAAQPKLKGAAKPVKLFATEDARTGKFVLRFLERFQLRPRLQALVDQAGVRWRVPRLIHACIGLLLAGFMILDSILPVRLWWVALGGGLFLGSLPLLTLRRKRASRLKKFEEQFPESLEFVARSMRAGHAFAVSLEMLHREFREPLAGEFRRTFEEHNLGLPLDTALEKLARRVPSLDVHFFVSAVLLQKRTGGNLAEILDKLAYTIRERFKLRGKIKAISAHGRVTGMALTAIPAGVAVLLCFANPSYIQFFVTDQTGQTMAAAVAGLQIMGYLIIQKIVNIEV